MVAARFVPSGKLPQARRGFSYGPRRLKPRPEMPEAPSWLARRGLLRDTVPRGETRRQARMAYTTAPTRPKMMAPRHHPSSPHSSSMLPRHACAPATLPSSAPLAAPIAPPHKAGRSTRTQDAEIPRGLLAFRFRGGAESAVRNHDRNPVRTCSRAPDGASTTLVSADPADPPFRTPAWPRAGCRRRRGPWTPRSSSWCPARTSGRSRRPRQAP